MHLSVRLCILVWFPRSMISFANNWLTWFALSFHSYSYKCNARGYPGVYSSVAKQMDFINQASGYAISGRSSTQSDPIPTPPTPTPVEATNCSDLSGWVYYFHNDKKKSHTCSEIATMNSDKRATVCQSEQRNNNSGSRLPVSASCKATCGVC